jgi:hypothetical protein
MAHLLYMTYYRQHRQHSFYFYTLVPPTAATEFEVGGVALGTVKAHIAQYDHVVGESVNELVESAVVHISGVAVPSCDQSESVEHEAEFASN